jgi:hypothetical protein
LCGNFGPTRITVKLKDLASSKHALRQETEITSTIDVVEGPITGPIKIFSQYNQLVAI